MTAPVGWDDPRTAHAYERFCRTHRRYRVANDVLATHAALEPGHHVLDMGAGTGRTARAVLPHIGARGSVLCAEPARSMREAGARHVRDSRVTWTDAMPTGRVFDRVLCGASIWLLLPLGDAFKQLAALVAPGGALSFNVPAAYLSEPDAPGGGRDPLLVELVSLVERPVLPAVDVSNIDTSWAWPRQANDVDRLLADAGLRPERWSFELRLTQAAYRDWLKIPPVSEGMFAGVPPDERARRLDAAYQRADRRSWRRERWLGWTAWRTR